MGTITATDDHEQIYQELCAIINKRVGDKSKEHVLAIAANMVGKLIAMQDQRTMTRDGALRLVMKNIELGNQQVLDALDKTQGAG
jgi:hypothetical protein